MIGDPRGDAARARRTRVAFAATSAAAKRAAESGVDLLALSRNPLVAAALETGIHAEVVARSLKRDCAFTRPVQPVHVHEGGAGPGIVFLNGWTASGLVWPSQLIAALEQEHRVVRVDNRGSGWSRHAPRPYTMGDLAGDARQVIDDLGLDRPTVIGLSMGGMIAQELAMRWPDRVGHLVLLATRPPSPEDTPAPPRVSASLLSTPPSGMSLHSFLRDGWATVAAPGFATAHPDLMDEMAAAIAHRPTPQFAVLDQARAIAAWSGASRLRQLTVPTTVVHGSEDPLVPVRNGMRLAQLISGARYVELTGVGHLIPFEAPDAVQTILTNLRPARRA